MTFAPKFFVVFHSNLYDELYQSMSPEDKSKLVMYGVSKKYIKNYNPSHAPIFEYDLPNYRGDLQENLFNETSALYHVYANNLHQDVSHIGFAQYDMRFHSDTFQHLEATIQADPNSEHIFYIFGFDLRVQQIVGALQLLNCTHKNAIDSYNAFFGTKFTFKDLLNVPVLIMNNTFFISRRMYEKMMPWMLQYLDPSLDLSHLGSYGNFGNAIEVVVGMFLAFEYLQGAKMHKMKVDHVWPHYKLKSYS
jgi:hypothetical protein